MSITKKKTADYVNNEQFYLEMVRYKDKVEECRKLGLPKPRVSDYIGSCILLIAKRLSNNKNFKGYSPGWKEEMISDGIENCILYIDNFDPDKTTNPFAYFTQIIWYAFIRRINKEKKQQYIKAKNLQSFAIMDALNNEVSIESIMPTDALNDLIIAFETPSTKKKKPNPKGLKKFCE